MISDCIVHLNGCIFLLDCSIYIVKSVYLEVKKRDYGKAPLCKGSCLRHRRRLRDCYIIRANGAPQLSQRENFICGRQISSANADFILHSKISWRKLRFAPTAHLNFRVSENITLRSKISLAVRQISLRKQYHCASLIAVRQTTLRKSEVLRYYFLFPNCKIRLHI